MANAWFDLYPFPSGAFPLRCCVEILIFFSLHWYASLFCQTFFLHRYSAHRMFRMSPAWEKFFFIFTYLSMGTSYLRPASYGVLHRLHHVYADTEKDPHSPKFSSSLMSMMMKTWKFYVAIGNGTANIPEEHTKNLPRWGSFENLVDSWGSRILMLSIYIGFYIVFATSAWMYLLLPVHFLMGPVHGAIINWYGHKFGYRNYDLNDTSRNMFPVDLLMFGEGLHNNHHQQATSTNFAAKWYEFDPCYPLIKALSFLRIITVTPKGSP